MDIWKGEIRDYSDAGNRQEKWDNELDKMRDDLARINGNSRIRDRYLIELAKKAILKGFGGDND